MNKLGALLMCLSNDDKRVLNPKDVNLSSYESWLEDQLLCEFRVWADGTIQPVYEESFSFMSDDYVIVRALDEDNAYEICKYKGFL